MVNLPKRINEHCGRLVDRMLELLKSGEVPMSVATLMRNRLEQGAEFPDLWNNWYDTSDLVVYPEGNDEEIYFLLTVNNKGEVTPNGRKALELIRPENLASNRGVVVEQLKDLEGKGLIKVSRNKLTIGKYLTQEQALKEITLRILARHQEEVPKDFAESEDLLKNYEAQVRTKTGLSTNMAVYLGDSLEDKTTLKAWYVNWLGCRSYAYGSYDLGGYYGRLLGIAPEAPGKGVANQLEAKIQTALDSRKPFE